ncbi:MAG: PDZ domain-containing protein [Xanthomonadales bacterium]|nr:PDZ domain-containing protein [Xanthomonadales bacterium]
MRPLLSLSLLLLLSAAVHAETAYYRDPALRGDTLVFTAEGDLWRVSVNGGSARRLTTNAGMESQAAISPDGRWIAFVGSYDASPEVYVMPMAGGAPKRLSFDGAGVRVQGWTPQGEVLFMSTAVIGPGASVVLRAADPESRVTRTLPFADANQGSFDDQGNLYFTRFGLHMTGDHARDYRGGAMAQLWRAPADGSSEAVRIAPAINASLSRPMWWNGELYHLADDNGVANLWRMDADGGSRAALTQFTDFEVRDPELDAGRIVYQKGADIRLFDIASGEDRAIPIDIASDFEQRRTRWIGKPLQYFEDAALAGDGSRAVIVARGKLSVAGVDARRRVEIPLPADARARSAVMSADGQSVLAVTDIGGSEAIWRFPADGSSAGERLRGDFDARVWSLHPSPDGHSLAFDDKLGRLMMLDLRTRQLRELDHGRFGGDDAYSDVAWSPDSRYLAVARVDSSSFRPQLLLIARDDGRNAVLTSDRYQSASPAFSRDGKWLYFLSERSFSATPSSPWGDRNMGPAFDRRSKLYALSLQPGNRFPFQPPDELTPPSDHNGKNEKGGDEDSTKTPALAAVVWEGLAERLFELPLAAGNYSALHADDKRLYFLDDGTDPDGHPSLMSLAIDNEGDKPATFTADVSGYELSADGKKLLLAKWARRGVGNLLIVEAGAKAPEKLDKHKLRLDDWRLAITPAAEWRQMFLDAWRMHREFSFDPAMRGVDWDAVRQRYEPLLVRVADRDELDDLIGQMSAELGILHSQVRPGDEREDSEIAQSAALGAEFEQTASGLRIAHIYRGDPELPGERSPLAQPGVDARVGDLLMAVNGRAISDQAALADALANQAGKQVLLDLRRGGAAKPVVVVPGSVRDEAGLRQDDWEQRTRERTQAASNGRIGYLHLRAMTGRDIATFAREFYANVDKDGLIIDVRRNNGGNIDSWIIEKLLRRTWAFWTYADGSTERNMQRGFRGHLALLIDEKTYSDGETFAAAIKSLDLGPLIGQRTAGAGIWLSDRNRLVDGGMARVAEYPQFAAADGRWLIEGVGVAPDIAVVNAPVATFNGRDAQLEAAIAYLQDQRAKHPVPPLTPVTLPARGTSAQPVR